jgi:hypothetical protein
MLLPKPGSPAARDLRARSAIQYPSRPSQAQSIAGFSMSDIDLMVHLFPELNPLKYTF